MFADQLRKSLLQAAITGQLTKQLPTDGDARDLLKKIRAERAKLLAEKKIKADKPLSPISDDEIPFDLPENWCWCRLGEVCNYGTNETALPTTMKVEKLLIDLEDIEKDSGRLINRKFFDGTNVNSSKNIFRRGQVLFGKLRVYLNKVIVADEDGYCSSEILPLDFGKNILNRYAQVVLMSPTFLSYANACSYGTKMPRLGTKAGQLALFPLPPLAEQKRIVARLEEILAEFNELARDEQELTSLEENFPRRLKNSLLQAAIQGKLTEQRTTDGDARDLLKKIRAEKDKLLAEKKIKADKPLPPISDDEIPFDLPDNWCWCRLGDVSLKIHYGFTASANSTGNVKLLRITDIHNDHVNWQTVPRCEVTEAQKKEYILHEGDIVIARTGGTIGKTFVIENLPEDAVFASYLIRVVFSEDIFPKYIKIFMGSPLYWKQIRDESQGTGQPNVNGQSLKNLMLPLPPLDEQKRIVERLEELLPLCNELSEKL